MRVAVHLTLDGVKETILEGNASIFDLGERAPWEPEGLDAIGFWLKDWRYCHPEGKGSPHKAGVFVPWGSALFIEEKENAAVQTDKVD